MAFTTFFTLPTSSNSISTPSNLTKLFTPRTKSTLKPNKLSIFTPLSLLSDPYVLQIAETLEDSLTIPSPPLSPPLQKLRDTSSESLLSTRWPSRKDEPFRFTDVSFLKNYQIQPIPSPKSDNFTTLNNIPDTHLPNLDIIDGYINNNSSNLTQLPKELFIGSLSNLNCSEEIAKRVSEYVSSFNGDVFWSLNGVGTPDVILIYVPEGCIVETPLHLRYFSVKGNEKGSKTLPISNPRVLLLVEKKGEISLIEEFISGDKDGDNSCYWTNAVFEISIGEEAKVNHSYIQNQSLNSSHIKCTSVTQEIRSKYKLIEVTTGGKLSRHNLHIQQVGPTTITELSTFQLAITDQTHDLHSSLILNHPEGVSKQLHKCIVAHSLGQVVFDGNVQVNRYAQRTDAGQLTRSLLLEPKASVNVKPNLQIIADDVKCSHGATISDLEEDELFYFRARGIDVKTARKALIFSFASEVIEGFSKGFVREKVEGMIRELLDSIHCTK